MTFLLKRPTQRRMPGLYTYFCIRILFIFREINCFCLLFFSSLSLLSHETSEQSDLINESREDTLAEFEPLFLQVSICIRHDKDPMITCPISQIPTCLIDLVKNNIDAGEGGSKELDMSKLVIYLDLLKITLSKDIPIEFGTRHMDQVIQIEINGRSKLRDFTYISLNKALPSKK